MVKNYFGKLILNQDQLCFEENLCYLMSRGISREKAILTNEFKKKSPNRRFLRGTVTSDVNGQKVEITQVKSGNGILSSTLNSNCLIELEAGNEGVNKGDIVTIIKF